MFAYTAILGVTTLLLVILFKTTTIDGDLMPGVVVVSLAWLVSLGKIFSYAIALIKKT